MLATDFSGLLSFIVISSCSFIISLCLIVFFIVHQSYLYQHSKMKEWEEQE